MALFYKWQFITYRPSQYHAVAEEAPLRLLLIRAGIAIKDVRTGKKIRLYQKKRRGI